MEARDGGNFGPFKAGDGLEVDLEELVESIAGGNWNELAPHLYTLVNIITLVIVQSNSTTINSLYLHLHLIKNLIIYCIYTLPDYHGFMTITDGFDDNYLNVKAMYTSV